MEPPHPTTRVRPGAITALMAELAAEPARAGWARPLVPGEHIGRFEIVGEIGRGGFGVVHEARDLVLGRSVALKTLTPKARDPGSASLGDEAAALAEAEVAAHLAHPNIVHLYDAQRCEDGPFLVMELLAGGTLAERLARGPLPWREALPIAVAVARGLAHAHGHGVLHRDLKPANVFLCRDGQVKVLDFGLGRLFGREATCGGTPGYMAPEQRRGGPGDERSDVHALGVVLEEMITGERPAAPGTEAGPGGAAPAREGPGDTGSGPPLPAMLADLVGRMRAEDPAARPASGEAALRALLAVERALQPRRRTRLAWSVAGIAAAIAAGVAAWPRAEPLPPGRLAVALADAANASGDAALDGATVLLASALEQSPRASVLPRARLARAAGLAGDSVARLQGGAALAAARAAGAHLLLSLAIRPEATGQELEARGIDPRLDRTLFTIRERTGGAGGFLDALDRVAAAIRRELREDPASVSPPLRLAQVISPNPEAQAAYLEGRNLVFRGRPGYEAVAAYERAVAADPDFPLPRAMLALALAFRDRAAAERHLEAALAHPEKLPPRERRLVEAVSAMVRLDHARALERFDQVIAGWPDDPDAYRFAAELAAEWYGDLELARPYFEKLLAVGSLASSEKIRALERLGRLDEALALARDRAERGPGRGTLARLARFERLKGERAEALAAGRRALTHARAIPPVGSGPEPPPGDASFESLLWAFAEGDALDELQAAFDREGVRTHWILGLQGRRREALSVLDAGAPPASAAAAVRGHFHGRRADFVAGYGDAAAVRREVQAQLLLGVPEVVCNSVTLAWAGDLEGAERLERLWPMRDPRAPCTRLHQAMRSFRRGEPEAALRAMSGLDWAWSSYLRGEVLLAAGRPQEAVEELRRYRRYPSRFEGTNFALHAWPRSLYLEALALERSGDRDQAKAVLGRLLRLWRRADRDLPALREARALRARLAGGE